jgi:hypothetical protein
MVAIRMAGSHWLLRSGEGSIQPCGPMTEEVLLKSVSVRMSFCNSCNQGDSRSCFIIVTINYTKCG